MTSKNAASRSSPPKKSILSQFKDIASVTVLVPAGALLLSALSWVIIVGLQRLTNHCLIPHDSGTYIHLGNLATLGLLDFPTDYMAFGAFFVNFPIGFIAIAWYLFIFCLCSNWRDAWHKLPRRDRALRKQLQVTLMRNNIKHVVIGTGLCFLICFPFIRRYEILTAHEILLRHTFDWNERVYSLDRLTEIRRSVLAGKGGGVIFWDFQFSDGTSFTMDGGPSRRALTALLALPHVKSNVRAVNGRIEKIPGK